MKAATMTLAAQAEAARNFRTANPDVPFVTFPLYDGRGPEDAGKVPVPPKGPINGLPGQAAWDGTGWQKLVVPVPDDHPAWASASGYGILLAALPNIVCVDVDNPAVLTAAAKKALRASPGMSYDTRKGRHHWYRNDNGFRKYDGGRNASADFGEVFGGGAIRYIAGPGSAYKDVPEDLTIPADDPPLKLLLGSAVKPKNRQGRKRRYDPKPSLPEDKPIPEGRRNKSLFDRACAFIRNGIVGLDELVDELRKVPVEGRIPMREYETIAASALRSVPAEEQVPDEAYEPPNRPVREEPVRSSRPSSVPGLSAYALARLNKADLALLMMLPEDERETQAKWFINHPDVPGPVYDQARAEAAAIKQPADNRLPALVNHRLGDLTPHGQEILEDDLVVGYVGQWQTKQSYVEAGGRNFPAYLAYYRLQVRTTLPPKVRIQGIAEANRYLDNLPPPLEVGERNIFIPPPNEYALLRGHQQQGKSWVALHILKELDLPALYIDTERPGMTIDRAKEFGILEQTLIHSTPSAKDIQDLAEHPHQIVVVDAIGGLMIEENRASSIDDLRRVLQPVIADRHVIFIHHLNKAGDSSRGSGRIEQLASYIYEVEETEHPQTGRLIKVKPKKASDHRNRPQGLHIRYEVIDGIVLFEPGPPPSRQEQAAEGRDIMTAAWEAADPRETTKDGKRMLPTKNAIRKQLEAQGMTERKADQAVINATGSVFKMKPGRGYGGKPGLDLIRQNPSE